MVRHNDIGPVALLLHLKRSLKASFCADGFGFKVRHPRMHVGRAAALGGVVHQLHPLPLRGVGFLHGHGAHTVALLDQRRGQKFKLPREILMNK